MRRMRVVGWALGMTIAMCALAAAPAVAVTGPWLSPTDVAAAGTTSGVPHLAMQPDGTATAVFLRGNALQTATRPAGGTFGTPSNLEVAAIGVTIWSSIDIAVGADGTTVVAWLNRFSDTNKVVRASVRPPGGSFNAPVDLSTPGQQAENPSVAVAPDGRAFVTWDLQTTAGPPKAWTVKLATRPPGGTWGAQESVLVSGPDWLRPKVAARPDGSAVLVFYRSNALFNGGVVETSTRPPGGGITPPIEISDPTKRSGGGELAVAPDGTATVVFVVSTNNTWVVNAVTRPPGGAFGAPVPLSDGARDAEDPRVATGADGTTAVTWDRFNSQTHVVQARVRAPGGSFGPVVPLSPGGFEATNTNVAVAADGTVLASWALALDNAGNIVMQAATRPVGGDFTIPVNVSGANRINPFTQAIALAADGSAVALFERIVGPGEHRVTAALTANPPALLSGPSISGAAAVGSALTCPGASFVGASGLDTFWLRGTTQVARDPGYTVAAADQGAALTCRVRASNLFGTVEATSAPLVIPPAGAGGGGGTGGAGSGGGGTGGSGATATPPIARALPSIRGKARVGRTLSCRAGRFSAATKLAASWLRGTRTIKGARRPTYRLTRRDAGKIVACRTTAIGAGGTASTVSLGVLVRR